MVGGAGGGVYGSAGVYEELAERLQVDGVTSLRIITGSRTTSTSVLTTSLPR